MKRNKLRAAIFATPILICVALLSIAALPSDPGVTRPNFGRVRVGMARSEVEAIFGGPPARMDTLDSRWIGLFLM